MTVSKEVKDCVAKFWVEYYVKDSQCDLCGNSGWLKILRDMSPKIKIPVISHHFCICPNGITHREQYEQDGIEIAGDEEVPF
jgi:hypothetical protein